MAKRMYTRVNLQMHARPYQGSISRTQAKIDGAVPHDRQLLCSNQGGCSSREDGLPAPGSSGGQILVRVIAAWAVWLLSPVDSRHQGNLQQSSKHSAHNLHAMKDLLNEAVP